MRRGILSLIAGAVLALPLAANAAMWTFGGALNSNQETPAPTLLPNYLGGGLLTATLDDVTGDYSLSVFFTGLTGPATAAHIHSGVIGVAGGIVVGLGSPTTPAPGFGLYSLHLTLTPSEFNPAIKGGTAIAGDDTGFYVNIHTGANLGGEIRGQILVTSSPVPIPAALWLLGSGLVGVFSLRRRV